MGEVELGGIEELVLNEDWRRAFTVGRLLGVFARKGEGINVGHPAIAGVEVLRAVVEGLPRGQMRWRVLAARNPREGRGESWRSLGECWNLSGTRMASLHERTICMLRRPELVQRYIRGGALLRAR